MSRRNRVRTRRDGSIRDTRLPRGGPRPPGGWAADSPDPATLLDRMTLALLPLRLFLGVTFLYAGVDKLIDPAFLRATGPGSIGAQLAEFVKVSPIAPLVQVFGQTFPVEIGFLIAVAEIAVGLGTLTGLLFRLSAAGGLALSITFWLTASWATKPYYYGPDLPYALGWLTIALAGTGDPAWGLRPGRSGGRTGTMPIRAPWGRRSGSGGEAGRRRSRGGGRGRPCGRAG